MRIAIFGGSFDPPHKGHIAIVREALRTLPIDMLIVMPTFLNPFKERFAAPPHLRYRWLRKIFLSWPRVVVSDFEIRRGRQTYAIEDVEYIKRRYAPQKIYYIIGSDNLSGLKKWKNYKRLQKEVEFVVATRPGYGQRTKFRQLRVRVPISSTRLRTHPIRRYLPPIVAKEIIDFYRR